SSRVSNVPCCSTANELLKEYIASPSRRNEKERKRPRIEQDDGSGRKSSAQTDEVERKTARALAKVIREGLSQLALTPQDPCSISLYLDEETSYMDYAARLIRLAEQQSETQIALSWCMRFLAGCISLASPSLPALPAETSNVEGNGDIVRRQRSIARVVNLIVTGLWGCWRDNAFLVYHAFAVLGYKFKNIRALGCNRHPKIARMTVELLQKAEAPTLKFGGGHFDPSQLLCRLLKFEGYRRMCDALGLPPLPTHAQPPISILQPPICMPLIDALSNRLQDNLQPKLLCLTERAVGPQSSFIGNGLDVVNTPSRSSTESDSQVQETQAINSQATLSATEYDTRSGVERQASNSQAQDPPSVGNRPLHEGQTIRLQTSDANSVHALLENDPFLVDVTDMILTGYRDWDPYVIDIIPMIPDQMQTYGSRDPIS
ncbi:hypothetical protein FGG08_007187, partial [Glutinoglossum americanum]